MTSEKKWWEEYDGLMKTITFLKIFVFGSLGLCALRAIVSCMSPQETHHQLSATGRSATYFRDERSGDCFAGWDLGTNAQTITAVSCTPAVMQLSGGFKK